ncbi:MAG: flagellar basal body L-ring protein FlgH [Phycisphaerales bacterium]|nr:flagellar basal body L-ring protein FlgH [Phycisphaerales bacterium]
MTTQHHLSTFTPDSSRPGVRSIAAAALALAALAGSASGQNLFRAPMPAPVTQPTTTQPAPAAAAPAGAESTGAPAATPAQTPPAAPAPAAPAAAPVVTGAALMTQPPALKEVSLMVVVPPEPHKFQIHDKVDIIVNETSNQKHEQKLDAKKSYDLKGKLTQFPSLQALLLENELRNGIETPPEIGLGSSNDFKGSGAYERKDNFTARIAAMVIDVKPNGLLVVEARKTVESNSETQHLVLSGIVDPKDITKSNTVQSSQIADLTIRVNNTGQVKDSSEKGLIPRTLEQLFNF